MVRCARRGSRRSSVPPTWSACSDGPGPAVREIEGIERRFFDYIARGAPYGPDDGTLAPWAVVASLPFAPEIVLQAIYYCIHQAKLKKYNIPIHKMPARICIQRKIGSK